MAGKRLGLDSVNGDLFLTAIELQKKIDADVVLYENVKGLCSHEKYIYTYIDKDDNEVILRQKLKKKELKELELTFVENSKKEDSFKPIIKSNYKNTIELTLHTIEKLLLEDDRCDYQWQIIKILGASPFTLNA